MLYLRKLRHILRSRFLFKILVLLVILLDIIFTKCYHFKSKYKESDTTFIGIVTDFEVKDNKLVIELKAKEKLIVNYNYNNLIFDNLSYGDKLLIKGDINVPNSSTIFNTFDYKRYLYNKKIYYIVDAYSIDKIENNRNYLYTIKNILYERVDNLKSSSYIKTLLFGDNSLSNEVRDSYRVNGISHLFSISGMHINFIIGIIYSYLDRITYNKKIKYIICDVFLILYLIFAHSSSLFRCVIMNVLFSIDFIFKLDIKKVDIMLFTLIVCIIINPFIIYDIGFIYSYLISFFLIIYANKIKCKNKIVKIIYITIVSFLVSFPITVYNNYEVNILSIFINILMVPIVSGIILPLSIITLIFPIFDDILYFATDTLEKFSLSMVDINFMKIILCKPNIFLIIIYYIVIVIILNRYKYFYLFIILVIFHLMIPYFNGNLEITMLDVGQGDCFFISFPYNRGNILIDTGEDYDNYSKMKREIIPYIKSLGKRKIDYLVITHGDSDHIGGANDLINNFKVDHVILNKGEYSDLEKELINNLRKKGIYYTNNIEKINVHDDYLYFINNKVNDSENDNSNVIYFEYDKYKFLFMGDASFKVEDYLLEKYNINNISFLKVGHHGSSTSSSYDFIKSINPKVSLVSVGENNFYGHPSKEVLDTLSNSKIYRTDIDGSIVIKINKNSCKVRTCSS